MNCPKCGNDVAEGNFCSVCGHKLDSDVEQEVPNAESENKIKDFFKSLDIKKAIMVSFSAIFLAGLTAFGIMQYSQYQKDTAPLDITSGSFAGMGKAEMNIRYNSANKRAIITLVFSDIKGEDWINEYIADLQKSNPDTLPAELIIPENDYTKELKINYNGVDIQTGKPIIIYFYIENVNSKEFMKIKDNISKAEENNQIFIKKYKILDKDKKFQLDIKDKWLKEKESEKFYKEADSIASKWAFKNVGEKIVPIDFNPRKCLFNVKGICFGHPFFVHGMSYEDCKATSNITGILNCAESQDLYATNVYVCGGKKNMPTPDELVVLAHDMYNNNGYDNIIFNEPPGAWGIYNGGLNSYKGQRDNTKYYIEYFRNTYWTNKTFSNKDEEEERLTMPFSIISSLEENDKWIYGRIYTDFSTGLIATRRFWHDSNHYSYWPNLRQDTPRFSICVDRNMSTPLKNSYPVKRKDTEKDFENDLF